MKPQGKQLPAGEIRQSQILSTYGPGSMVDLPDKSILIGGLNHWLLGMGKKRIFEERLEKKIAEILGVQHIILYEPPSNNQDNLDDRTGINTFVFPDWFVAQVDQRYPSETGKYITRPLVRGNNLQNGQYEHTDRKKYPVVPVRFVQACTNGHISDINWSAFVHKEFNSACRGKLWLDEGGTGNDFADIFVRCECSARRPLSDATIPNAMTLGPCRGDRPWLGPHAQEICTHPETGKPLANRLLVRSASNAYFSQILNVISLPNQEDFLRKAVDRVYEDFLQYVETKEDLPKERRRDKVKMAIADFSDEQVWQEIQRRQGGYAEEGKTIKQLEIETLLAQSESIGEDKPEGDFYARNRPVIGLNSTLKERLERIVLVHRLREVRAQVGFTRFEPAIADIDGELLLNVRPAALDLDMTWVPAVENRGEGVFLAFRQGAITEWLEREAVKKRGQALLEGFTLWRKRKGIKENEFSFPGLPYIMLHSLSHLLITTLSLDCGYSASAIRERIYAGPAGYGILLYTGSSGSEGTLGGLIQEGKRIEQHLERSLELGRLCSNDPVCAHHRPNETYEERFLHGAACHSCLLIAETSCERRNEFLDRALVVETVAGLGSAFFA